VSRGREPACHIDAARSTQDRAVHLQVGGAWR
jgi:hypothetical protein